MDRDFDVDIKVIFCDKFICVEIFNGILLNEFWMIIMKIGDYYKVFIFYWCVVL